MTTRSELPPISDEIEHEHRAVMNAIASHLKDLFPGFGFALLIFDFSDKGRMNWISNAKRADMISALREAAAVLEGGGPHDAPTTKQ